MSTIELDELGPPLELSLTAEEGRVFQTGRSWTVWKVDDARGVIDLKIGDGYDGPLQGALAGRGARRQRWTRRVVTQGRL